MYKIENFRGKHGYSISNQFIITEDNRGEKTDAYGFDIGEVRNYEAFQSHNSVIVKKDYSNGKIYLDKNYWDFSKETGEYRDIFLGENKKIIEEKIKNGEYILADLNK